MKSRQSMGRGINFLCQLFSSLCGVSPLLRNYSGSPRVGNPEREWRQAASQALCPEQNGESAVLMLSVLTVCKIMRLGLSCRVSLVLLRNIGMHDERDINKLMIIWCFSVAVHLN